MSGTIEVQIFPDGQGFIAVREDQRGLSAYGETPEAAARELRVLLDLAREIAEEDGDQPGLG